MDNEPELYRRPELLAAGYTDNELRTLRGDGTVDRLRRGAYLFAPLPAERLDRYRALIRAEVAELSPDAVISHLSAAALYGLPIWGRPLDRVCATRHRVSGARKGRLVHLHAAPMDGDEVRLVAGIAVTSPARTLIDIAREVSFEQAVVVADAALGRGLLDREELLASARSARLRPRARNAWRVACFVDGRSESVGESRSRVAFRRTRLPIPELQIEIRDSGGMLLGRPDFLWEQQRVVGEFDGKGKYGRLLRPGQEPRDVLFAEKLREDALRRVVRTVIRWTWSDLTDFAPVAARIRTALG